jgi:spore maturation protein CgeB
MRSFKILRISHLAYPQALSAFLNKNKNFNYKSYNEQLTLFFNDKLVYGDSFSRAMNRIGHECYEVVYDLEITQKKWAFENNIDYDNKNWVEEIVLSQIKYYKPEIIYFQHYPPLQFNIWSNLKNIFPSVKKIIVHRAFPGNFDTLHAVDLLLVGSKKLVEQYKEHNIKANLVYHYFDETIINLSCINNNIKDISVSFLGSSGFGYGLNHATRYWTLKELLEKVPSMRMWLEEPDEVKKDSLIYNLLNSKNYIDFKIISKKLITKSFTRLSYNQLNFISNTFIFPESIKKITKEVINNRFTINKNRYILKSNLSNLKIPNNKLINLYPNKVSAPIFGLDYYNILSRSRISFNRHTDAANGDVGNIRMFQSTGVGSCLLTDTGNNINDLFKEDTEILTYKTIDDAIDKINYLIQNPSLAEDIAKAGQKRTLLEHNAYNRCLQINDLIQKII